MLTHNQRKLLDFIIDYISKERVAPTYIEMQWAMRLHSKSGIHRLILELEERGHIRRLPNKARAIEVINDPHLNVPVHNALDHEIIRECQRRGYAVGRWSVRQAVSPSGKTLHLPHFVEVAI